MKLAMSLAGTFVVAACTMWPPAAPAQDKAFLVLLSSKDPKYADVYSANCGTVKLTEKDGERTFSCTLRKEECKPEDCKFTRNSNDQPPLSLVFGRSYYNPTCAWVFNWTTYTYSYTCW